MALINVAAREIHCKIVYYGPGLGGKTTNLKYIHSMVPQQAKGELISIATETERTLFFDFLPLDLGQVHGFNTRIHLFTVPGQVLYERTRVAVLNGADGVVFVADSQRHKLQEDVQSLQELARNVTIMGKKFNDFPVVLQYNKRDLENALPVDIMDRYLNSLPLFSLDPERFEGDLNKWWPWLSLAPDFAGELGQQQVSDRLRQQFQSHNRLLTNQTRVQIDYPGNQWTLADLNSDYIIRREDQVLRVYRRQISAALRDQFQRNNRPLSEQAELQVNQAKTVWTITDGPTKYAIRKENQALNVYGMRVLSFEASAARGYGVFDTLKAISKLVISKL
jgi:signal recognition particle receptor subunit beta